MALVDGPTGENDNMICVAYKHQFDLINESTGDAYRLHHVDANRVRRTCELACDTERDLIRPLLLLLLSAVERPGEGGSRSRGSDL